MDQIIKHGIQMAASLDPASQKELRATLETIFSDAGKKLDFNTPQNRANIENLAKAFQSIFSKAGNTSIDFSKIMQMPSDKMFAELGTIAATQFWDAWNAVSGGGGAGGIVNGVKQQIDALTNERNRLMADYEKASKMYDRYDNAMGVRHMESDEFTPLHKQKDINKQAYEVMDHYDSSLERLSQLERGAKGYNTALLQAFESYEKLFKMKATLDLHDGPISDDVLSMYGDKQLKGLTTPFLQKYGKDMDIVGERATTYYQQQIDQISGALTQLDGQISAIQQNNAGIINQAGADETLLRLKQIEDAYDRIINKSNGAINKPKSKAIQSALDYEQGTLSLEKLSNGYNKSLSSNENWEIQYQWLTKFVREYEAYAKMPNADQKKLEQYKPLYEQLEPMAENARNMLQNVLNMANNVPLVGMGDMDADAGHSAAADAQTEAEAEARARAESDAKVKSDIKSAEASKQAAIAAEQERAAKEASAQAAEKQAQLNNKIGYHYGNLFGGKSGARDTFGQTLDNLTIDAQPGSPSSYGYGVLGGGLFYVDDPNLFGDQAPSKGSKFINGVDFSKYNLYLANTEERVANLASLLSNLQRFAVKQAVPDYTGFDQQLSGVSIETLWQQMQVVFENVNMTKQEFNQFIQEMIRLLQSSGAYLEQETGELAFNNIPDAVDGSDNMSTRLLKRLGYQGVSTAGTSFNGMDQGSVLFDFQNDDIIAFFDKLDAAIQHYNKTLTESDPSKITNSLQIVKEIDAIIERINTHKSIMTEATGGKFDTSGYDTTLKELEARRAMLVASDENINKIQQEAVAHNNNSGAIKEESAAQERLNQAEGQNPPAQEEVGVHNANAEAINAEANAQERLNVAESQEPTSVDDTAQINNETGAVAQQIQSYEQLCKVVEKYNQLVAQGGIKSPADIGAFDDIASQLDGVVSEDQLNKFKTPLDANQLAQQLSVEIPQAANNAKQAIDGLNSSLEKKNAIESADNGASEVAEENAETQAIQQQNQVLQENIDLKTKTGVQTGTPIAGAVPGGVTTDGGADVSAEAGQLTNLQSVLAAVTTAVAAKTQAFTAEEAEVSRVVGAEIASLDLLEQKVLSIKGTLEGLLSNLKTGQSDVGAGLSNITVTVNNSDGADAEQKGLWALDTTVQSVKTSLDGVRTDLSNVISAIGNINIQQVSPDAGVTLATEATLGAVKAVLDAINGKIVAGTKGGSGKQSEGKKESSSEKKTDASSKKTKSKSSEGQDEADQLKKIASLEADIGKLRGKADNETNERVKQALEEEIRLRERLIQLIKDGSVMSEEDEARQKTDLSEKTKAARKAAAEEEKAQKKAIADQQKAEKQAYADFVKDSKKEAGLSEAASTINKTRGTLTDAALIDNKTPEATAKVQQLHAALEQLNEKYKQIRASDGPVSDEDQQELIAQRQNVQQLQSAIAQLVEEHQKLSGANAQQIGTTSLGLGASSESQQKAITDAVMAATKGRAAIKGFSADTNELTYTLKTGTNQFTTFKAAIDRTNGSIMTVRGNTTQAAGVFATLGKKIKEYSYYFTGSMMIYRAIAWVREGITAIKDIDTALTELKKVTDATTESYEKFVDAAAKTADKVGSTIKEVISSTADWARLGYSMKEAAELATSTQILMNVSEFTDINQATDSLISSIQAFKYTAEESMDVVDILNTIGNNYAISTADLAQSLTKSSGSLVAANGTLQEAVALTAAANTIIQDADVVGTALKTVAMRLRGKLCALLYSDIQLVCA